MKFTIKAALMTSALIGFVALGGCGGDDKKSGDKGATPAPAAGGDSGGAAPAGDSTYDAAKSTGSVNGSIKFAGTAPPPQMINVSSDVFCAGAWKAKPLADEKFTVNGDGTLPNVFVWAFKGPHKGMKGFEAPTDFVLDQVDCVYTPHVFGVMAGQEFTIKNSDTTTHNVNIAKKRNPGKNMGQPAGAEDKWTFAKRDSKIPFKCDVHSWMSAWAFALDHPFFATTDDKGGFEIKGLPAGEYTFKAWHENFGEAEWTVTVGAAATSTEATVAK